MLRQGVSLCIRSLIGYDEIVTHPLLLREMRLEDVPAVAALESAAFTSGWSHTAFERELTQNAAARYLVLESTEDNSRGDAEARREKIPKDAAHFSDSLDPSSSASPRLRENPFPARLLGFAGLWLMFDEAHVVTVAVAEADRRHGYGRILVHHLVQLAAELGMTNATLECRLSNTAARALYRDYGFYEVGERKAYYSDNHEDAVIMTTEAFATPAYQQRLKALAAKLPPHERALNPQPLLPTAREKGSRVFEALG